MSQLVACLLGKHINPSLYTYQPGKNLNVAVSAYNEGTDGERQGERQREGEMNPWSRLSSQSSNSSKKFQVQQETRFENSRWQSNWRRHLKLTSGFHAHICTHKHALLHIHNKKRMLNCAYLLPWFFFWVWNLCQHPKDGMGQQWTPFFCTPRCSRLGCSTFSFLSRWLKHSDQKQLG